MAEQTERFPIKHVVGFLLSVVLTLIAAWAALSSGLPTAWMITSIMVLAILQAGIQLFMFMHMTESKSGTFQAGTMVYGFSLAAIIVAGSIWTMSFGHSHNHDHGDHQQEEHHMEEHG